MSSVKTQVDEASVKQFLEKRNREEIQNLQFIRGGQLSQAFTYRIKDNDYVIKIRKDIESLEKEKAIFDKLSKTDQSIPLPKIFEIDIYRKMDDHTLFYCISEKCEGRMLYQLGSEIEKRLTSTMLEILCKIHLTDISETKNYGDWLEFLKAPYQTWAMFLQEYTKKHIDYLLDFFTNKPEERNIIEKLEQKINELLPLCPEERYLIHGDYGPHNTIATPEEITGIIDWELSKFGDFVYDIAWLEYFGHYGKERASYAEAYRKIHETRRNQKIKHYDERLHCYTLCVGLHMAYFYCMSGQLQAFQADKGIILELLK